MSVADYREDIPSAVAYAAHSGTSFVPERRQEQERDGYADTLRGDHSALLALADTDEKRAMLEDEFARYRAGYRKRTLAYLHSRSGLVSVMIAGPSRFPVDRMNKRGNVVHKRLTELIEFRKRALEAIRRKLCPELRPIMAGDADAVERLQAEIDKAERLHDAMKQANEIIRRAPRYKPTPEKLADLMALGLKEHGADELFRPDFANRMGFPDYALRNSGANIRRMKARLEQIRHNQAMPETSTEGDAARLEDCPAENRVRLFFPGKPDATIREKLKGSGFRWAPSLGCWQAYRNHNSLRVARDAAGLSPQEGTLKWWATCRGFKCFIRCSRVWCWVPGSNSAQVTAVDNDHWLEHTDIYCEPWRRVELTPAQRQNFEAAARDCYCYKGVDRCDFCTSTRTPDGVCCSSGAEFSGVSLEDRQVG